MSQFEYYGGILRYNWEQIPAIPGRVYREIYQSLAADRIPPDNNDESSYRQEAKPLRGFGECI